MCQTKAMARASNAGSHADDVQIRSSKTNVKTQGRLYKSRENEMSRFKTVKRNGWEQEMSGENQIKVETSQAIPTCLKLSQPGLPGRETCKPSNSRKLLPYLQRNPYIYIIIWRRKIQSSLISEICGSSSMEVPGLLFCCWPPCQVFRGVGRASRFKHSLKSTWRSLTRNPCT